MTSTLALKSKRVLTPTGFQEAFVLIENGKILSVSPLLLTSFNGTVEDCGDNVVMAGVIDCHVHINEPGRTEWEGFDTATKAAAAGGITTLIEMPLNASPVTTNVPNYELKLEAATGKLHVNCGFWGGVVPHNLHDLDALLQKGTFGLKAFLTHSGIDEFPNTTAEHLRHALTVLKKYDKPLLVHCELDTPHDEQQLLKDNPQSYQAYLRSRPKSWENEAVNLMINLCRETGARVHIVHLSSAEALPQIRAARAEGLPLTVETCPQYLVFEAENIPDATTAFKCAPPIREKANNNLLWQALKNGNLDFIASDHSPAPPTLKETDSGNFEKAWGGIAGLQFTLPVIWTAAQKHGISLERLAELLSQNVAKFLKMSQQKGEIAAGFDADIVVWSPEKTFVVEEKNIQHRHKITPYKGLTLHGVVQQTYVGGAKVFDNNSFIHTNKGQVLLA